MRKRTRVDIMKHLSSLFILVAITLSQYACSNDVSTAESLQLSRADTTFSDRDGNTYRARRIGTRYWMVDNFKGTRTAEGRDVNGAFVYRNEGNNVPVYGRLYTWYAAVQAAPRGWRLPTKEEWEELFDSLGGVGIAGGKLKESGTAHWNSPNTGATNSLGFTGLPGGFRGPDGTYYELGRHGDYWGTALNGQEPFCVYLYNTTANVSAEVSPVDRSSGIAFSVRYVTE